MSYVGIKQLEAIVGDKEELKKKQYEKADSKIKKFDIYHKEKSEREIRRISQKIRDETHKTISKLESQYHEKLQKLEAQFRSNKEKIIEQILNEVIEG